MKANTLRLGINIILSLSCLALLALILSQYFFTQSGNNPAGLQLVQSSNSTSQNFNWRWFGSAAMLAGQDAISQIEAEQQLAEASINAVLLGVVRTQGLAAATISVNGQQEKVFTIGDELRPGVELLRVTTSRVVLNERGREVQLSMPKPEDMLIQVRAQRANQQSGAGSSTALLDNGFSLANMFDALPVQLENSATGIQLGGISEEMLSLSDLQDGDVVMQVGGSSIDELMANPSQWMSYTTETTLPVTVMRNGQETTLYVNAFSLSARILPNLTSELMQ